MLSLILKGEGVIICIVDKMDRHYTLYETCVSDKFNNHNLL